MAVSLYLQRIELKITKHKKVKISDSGSEESRFEPWQDNPGGTNPFFSGLSFFFFWYVNYFNCLSTTGKLTK
jgi:hypothetical protein